MEKDIEKEDVFKAQQEDLISENKTKKFFFLRAMTNKQGWKKDLKKIGYGTLILLACALLYLGAIKFAKNASWNLRFDLPVQVVKYQKYSHQNPNFSFKFPTKYVFDADEQKKYGDQYLAGFHLSDDARTGCDVRLTGVGINFAKSDQQISDAIYADLSKNVKGLNDFSAKRIKLGDQPAIQSDFSLTDPLNNTLHIKQIMVTNNNQDYLLVCGSGKAQYEFFQKDFQDFLDSFNWR